MFHYSNIPGSIAGMMEYRNNGILDWNNGILEWNMCRNIRKLRNPEREPADDELRNAALQFVRKISGYREPSTANREAFENAVEAVTEASRDLFDSLDKGGRKRKQVSAD